MSSDYSSLVTIFIGTQGLAPMFEQSKSLVNKQPSSRQESLQLKFMMKIDGWVGCFDEGLRCDTEHEQHQIRPLAWTWAWVSEYSQSAQDNLSDNEMLLGSLTCWDKLLVQLTL
jgi:hypothetical protein